MKPIELVELFISACQSEEVSLILQLLEKGLSVDVQDDEGITPLQMASAYGQDQVVELLLRKGANVNLCNHCGWSPLMHALFNGHEDVARLLLENRADFSAPNKLGVTPLAAACSGGHLHCVSLLLESDQLAFPQKHQVGNNYTPLMAAALNGHEDVLRLLMDHDVNINQADNISKLTALMLAASNGQRTTVQMLIEHGADANLTSVFHRTALDIASACEKWEIKAYLGDKTITHSLATDSSKEFESPVVASIYKENVKELKRLLDLDPDACNRFDPVTGHTPLMQAAILGHFEAVSLLLKMGADVDAQENKSGWTALMLSVYHRKLNIVTLLLDVGANIEIRGSDGFTVFDLVCVSDSVDKDLMNIFINPKKPSKQFLTASSNSPTSSSLKSYSKRSALRRSFRNNSFRSWMSSRFNNVKRSRSSASLSATSPPICNGALSDEDEENTVFFPGDTPSPQSTQNTALLKLSTFQGPKKVLESQKNWAACKQVNPPLLPSPSKWTIPLPKEYLPPVKQKNNSEKVHPPIKEFNPVLLLRRYKSLQQDLSSWNLQALTPLSNLCESNEDLRPAGQWAQRRISWREPSSDQKSVFVQDPLNKHFPNTIVTNNTMGTTTAKADDVEQLLHHLSLDKYVQKFQDHEMDLEALKGVTEEDLEEIGVHSVGPRHQLLAAISKLQ